MPEEYFDSSRTTIFNHEWSLAGRRDQLDHLAGVAYQASATLAFVTGTGGIGKTRILKAIADAAPAAVQVRVLSGDAQVSAADFELLPYEDELTVVIDDAHELTQVAGIVAGIWRRNRNAKIVLATRPYGFQALKEELARHGLLPMPHTEVQLDELDLDDATSLAREALGGSAPEAVARRLATLTNDSPLATVVGGVLIRQGELEPSSLEQDENVRFYIMRGFREALVNDPLAYDPPTRRTVLDALAALQPFRTDDPAAREALSAIVGKPYDELYKHLRSLENAGILRRRNNSLRIVPDLLGDVILTEATYDNSPLGTGYLARIEHLITGTSVDHLFINVSRVDWQIRNTHDKAPNLADTLWDAFQARIEAADIVDRRSLAETLVRVAYFQPQRALQATRWLIDHPTEQLNGEHSAWRTFLASDYRSVLHVLPPALKLTAMSVETLPEALNQLWELAQLDERSTNQHPEHALRVLCELAEFEVAKPTWFNEQIVDVASSWFADSAQFSPFDVLEPMLATEGEDSRVHGYTITFKPYSLDPQSVLRVRKRVIDLAFKELTSSNLRRSGAAAKFLQSALRYPTGRYGRLVSAAEREGWTPEFIETIERLGAAAPGGLDPAVVISIRDALHWHDNYGDGPAHEAAKEAVDSLPNTVETLLALTIYDGWGRLVRERSDNFEAMEAKRRELIQAVVDGLAGRSDDEVVDLLIRRLRADHDAHGATESYPGPVIAGLISARPILAIAILKTLRANPGSSDLDAVLPVVLATFAETDPEAALEGVRELLGSASADRRRLVSQSVGWNRGHRKLHPGELDLLLQLAADPDVLIRRNVARAAQLLAQTQKTEAIRLLAELRFGDAESLADEIFMCFRPELGISWSSFSDAELNLIRDDLLRLPGIGGYAVSEAIATRSKAEPAWVIALLQDRIRFADYSDSSHEYAAMPYGRQDRLRIRDSPDFLLSLDGVLAWIADDLGSWRRRKLGADLFAAVANGYDGQVVKRLENAIERDAENSTLAVAAVLYNAPRTFIWDRPDFVRAALHAADRLGEKVLRQMRSALRAATISGIRTGTPGEPFPETIEQRDRSSDIAKSLPAGSIEKRFFSDIAKSADADILDDTDDDLPSDGRAW